jgi:hypothetical protein
MTHVIHQLYDTLFNFTEYYIKDPGSNPTATSNVRNVTNVANNFLKTGCHISVFPICFSYSMDLEFGSWLGTEFFKFLKSDCGIVS